MVNKDLAKLQPTIELVANTTSSINNTLGKLFPALNTTNEYLKQIL